MQWYRLVFGQSRCHYLQALKEHHARQLTKGVNAQVHGPARVFESIRVTPADLWLLIVFGEEEFAQFVSVSIWYWLHEDLELII